MGNFYTLLSNTGINAIIAARASNSEVKLTKIAVGDGDIIPSQDMTSLKSEKHRFNINSIIQDIDNPNYLIVEGVIPSNVGGFYVSEVAIYTEQNTLFAIGSLPKTYKPLLEEGSAKDLTIKIFLEITNADSVTLKVDDSVVLATRKFVLSELKKHTEDKKNPHAVTKAQIGLEFAENTKDEDKKVLSATKLLTARAITVGNTSKNFDGSANIAFSLAEIGSFLTENIATNGYVVFPNGLILQWGRFMSNTIAFQDINYNIAFPTRVLYLGSGATFQFFDMDNPGLWTGTIMTNSYFKANRSDSNTTNREFCWFAIGY